MTSSFFAPSRRSIAWIILAAGAVAAGACSSIGTGVSPLSNQAPAKPATTFGYSFTTVDYEQGSNTVVAGINNSNPFEIVGFYSSGSSTGSNATYNSFTTSSPYSQFNYDSYPDAPLGTQMMSITTPNSASPLPVEAGWVNQPGGENGSLNSNWGAVDNQGLWSVIRQYQAQGGSKGAANYLFGIQDVNGTYTAVGYYTQPPSSPNPIAYKVQPGEHFFNIDLPNSWNVVSSEATGINVNGDMVGFYQANAAKRSVGWYDLKKSGGKFGCFSIDSDSTTPYGINQKDQIVGSYVDGTGVSHGFLYAPPSTSGGSTCSSISGSGFTMIDYTTSLGDTYPTEVRGINDVDDICGWYKKNGLKNGFVATPHNLQKPRR
jgi:hypothetical protein